MLKLIFGLIFSIFSYFYQTIINTVKACRNFRFSNNEKRLFIVIFHNEKGELLG